MFGGDANALWFRRAPLASGSWLSVSLVTDSVLAQGCAISWLPVTLDRDPLPGVVGSLLFLKVNCSRHRTSVGIGGKGGGYVTDSTHC